MIVDSHCHAWRTWPYVPPVPDPTSRPAVEQLLFEMDECGVQEAVLVAARIDHNPDNNEFVAECVRRFPQRLYQFTDVDCMWTSTYHTPGGADRLAEAVQSFTLRGFTHYVDADDDGTWFFSDDGQGFLRRLPMRRQLDGSTRTRQAGTSCARCTRITDPSACTGARTTPWCAGR